MVVVGAAVHQPVAGVTVGASQSGAVNGFQGLARGEADQREHQNRRCEERDAHAIFLSALGVSPVCRRIAQEAALR